MKKGEYDFNNRWRREITKKLEINQAICEAKEVEVIIINKGEENVRFEEELAKDVLEIITVFSTRLYGSRSNKNKKLLEDVNKAVAENLNSKE